MLLVACDVSKTTLDAAWFDEQRQRWWERSKIPNTRRGWRGLLDWLEKNSGQGRAGTDGPGTGSHAGSTRWF